MVHFQSLVVVSCSNVGWSVGKKPIAGTVVIFFNSIGHDTCLNTTWEPTKKTTSIVEQDTNKNSIIIYIPTNINPKSDEQIPLYTLDFDEILAAVQVWKNYGTFDQPSSSFLECIVL